MSLDCVHPHMLTPALMSQNMGLCAQGQGQDKKGENGHARVWA